MFYDILGAIDKNVIERSRLIETYISPARREHTMAGATKIQDVTIDEIELEACEIEELDRLAEETRKCGISWEDLKAELGL